MKAAGRNRVIVMGTVDSDDSMSHLLTPLQLAEARSVGREEGPNRLLEQRRGSSMAAMWPPRSSTNILAPRAARCSRRPSSIGMISSSSLCRKRMGAGMVPIFRIESNGLRMKSRSGKNG